MSFILTYIFIQIKRSKNYLILKSERKKKVTAGTKIKNYYILSIKQLYYYYYCIK